MRKSTVIMLAMAMAVATAAPASAASESGVDSQPLVEHYNLDGTASGETIGRSNLIRRSEGLKASVQASNLIPGGVYTFWWVVTPLGGEVPVDSFVALGGSSIVGSNGKATIHMKASSGESSIDGFLLAFRSLDFDLASADVRVEIAYHGQAADAGAELGTWLSDFWTGAACPEFGQPNVVGQPFCPVFIGSVHN